MQRTEPIYNLESDLENLIITNKFIHYLIEKSMELTLSKFPNCDKSKLKWNRIEWVSRYFFINLAKGNIENFHIKSFENDLFDNRQIEGFLEHARNFYEERKKLESTKESELRENSDFQGKSNSDNSDNEQVSGSSESSPRSGFSGNSNDPESPRELGNSFYKFLGEYDKEIPDSQGKSNVNCSENSFIKSKKVPGDGFLEIESYSECKVTKKRYKKHIILEYKGLTVSLSNIKYSILTSKYKYLSKFRSEIIFACAFRYQTIGDNNFHLAIPPSVVNLVHFECFGNPWNAIKPCFTALPEIDQYFGSKGNYFTDDIPKNYNIISFNPPYDEEIFKMAVNRLILQMRCREKSPEELTVLATLPVWDPETQDKYKFYKDKKFEGKKFEGMDILRSSGLIRESIVLTKEQAPFYDYITKKFVSAVNIHLMILCTGKPKLTLAQVWPRWNMNITGA